MLILLTDGDNNAGVVDPREAARIAAESGIRLYTIGIGRNGTVPIPQEDEFGNRVLVPAQFRIDEELLARHGQDRATASIFTLPIPKGWRRFMPRSTSWKNREFEETKYSEYTELFRWFAGPGLASDSPGRRLDGNPVSFLAVGRQVRRWNGNIREWLVPDLAARARPGWCCRFIPAAGGGGPPRLSSAQAMWPRILPADSRARFWVKLLLREIALSSPGWSRSAGPRFGTQYEEVVPRGSDLYVLIDVSRSMLAEDVPPSRLGRAKADVAALVNRLEGERVGLIAFAGQAVVKCPLTVDYDAFRRSLDELDPRSAPRGGTAIGDAIRKALEVFQARPDRDQAILLDHRRRRPAVVSARSGRGRRRAARDDLHRRPGRRRSRRADPAGGRSEVVRRIPGPAGLEQARRLAAQGDRARRLRAFMCRSAPAPTIWVSCTRNTCKAVAAATSRGAEADPPRRTSSRSFWRWRCWPCWPMCSPRPYPAVARPADRGIQSARVVTSRARGEARQPALPVCDRARFWSRLCGVSRADRSEPKRSARD